MTRAITSLAMASTLCLAAYAGAISPSAARADRHQLAACMTKQMAASKTISYYEAAKICKDQLTSQGDRVAANDAPKPAGVRQYRSSHPGP